MLSHAGGWYGWVRPEKPVKLESPEQLDQYRKVQAADAEIAQYERRASIILLVLILMNALALAVLVYYMLNHQ